MSHEVFAKLKLIQQRNVEMANRLDHEDPITAAHHDATAEIARRKHEEIYGPKAHHLISQRKVAR